MTTEIYTCKLLKKTLDAYKNNKLVIKSFKEFVAHKVKDLHVPFGSKDYAFRHSIKGFQHAALTHDVRIVYRAHDGKLELYGIFSHDEMGTGQPPNINKAKQVADKLSNQTLVASSD